MMMDAHIYCVALFVRLPGLVDEEPNDLIYYRFKKTFNILSVNC